MYICMHIFYIHTYTSVYCTRIYIYIYIFICTYIYIYCLYTYICIFIHIDKHTSEFVNVYLYINMCIDLPINFPIDKTALTRSAPTRRGCFERYTFVMQAQLSAHMNVYVFVREFVCICMISSVRVCLHEYLCVQVGETY